MDKTSKIQSMALSRRTIVTGSVAVAAGAAVLLGLVTEASAKMAQKAVEYQDTSKGDQERRSRACRLDYRG
jgi:secreted PhoX family phosphatase